jgi:3'-phosphoadenosine 5'-phosphosulfate sulfotransferase (PAPS reductase)/FAD synthetase/ferredoxin
VYSYVFDKKTRGYLLTTQTGKYVASEIRPVFAPELSLTGLGAYFEYDRRETRPLMWGMKNTYLVADVDDKGEPCGRKVAQLNNTQYGKPLNIQVFFDGKMKLQPVDVDAMVAANAQIMDIVVADAKRRTKELYDESIKRCDIAYIAFSGGKDSVVLLDICHRVLPLSVPVVFSDTDMELPDTYKVIDEIKTRYPDREFITAKAETSALENWRIFAPPSRTIRWCCSVHKSTPALMYLKKKLRKSAIKVMAFVGVRGDESYSRSFYEDATDGAKNASQMNRMPILDWGAHELWLYIFANDLIINCAYKKGLTRVGCLMCPESSEKYEWYVDKIYSRELKPYSDIIIGTSSKHFSSATEKGEYIGKRHWQARRSGIVLRESMMPPLEEADGLTVTFQSQHFKKDLFYQWVKTLGTVVKERETERQLLKFPKTLDEGIPFVYRAPYTGGGLVSFEFRSKAEQTDLLPLLRSLFRKVSGCVGCQSCEAECSFGAITFKDGNLKIYGDICTKCHCCYEIENSCWRYRSMYKPENSNSVANEFARYNNFGLREEFIDALLERGDTFFHWDSEHPIGDKKVDACKKWFPQALIVTKDRKHTQLVELFRDKTKHEIAWEFVWMALVNNSPLINWYCVTTELDERKDVQNLLESLQESYPLTNNAKDRRLDALKNTADSSPLGGDSNAPMLPEYKGSKVIALTRKAKEAQPLTILYGLYLIADLAERGSFTVRELLTADVDSTFVSPIVAFGIAPDTFKKQCEGLRTRYPDYISTTFTHGNDGLEVYPQRHSLEDIVNLALEG